MILCLKLSSGPFFFYHHDIDKIILVKLYFNIVPVRNNERKGTFYLHCQYRQHKIISIDVTLKKVRVFVRINLFTEDKFCTHFHADWHTLIITASYFYM